MLQFNRKYFMLAMLLLLTEIGIAIFVTDSFVRPYFGDFLVVMLIYCAIKSVLPWSVWQATAVTLIFAYLVEFAQYFRIVDRLGLAENLCAKTIIGYGFEWWDMLAYTLGIASIISVEKFCGQHA